MRKLQVLFLALTAAACGGGDGGSGVSRLAIEPGATLVTAVGNSVAFEVAAYDASGRTVSSSGAAWVTPDPEVATVSTAGVVTAAGSGVARVIAELDGVADTATFEVWLAPETSVYEPGTQYLGRQGYVEYVPGTLPVVISAPHGGALEPDEIPDRSYGTVVTDSYTAETLLAVRQAFLERTGHAPHVVISHLRRTKLDPNREIVEAAQGNPFAENAWEEFQRFIEVASDQVATDFGAGLYLDLHGHGHPVHRVELGYLLSGSNLNMADGSLDVGPYAAASSMAALAARSPLSFSVLLRGETSFGGFLEDAGVRSVPSPGDPSPGQDSYFSGGYNTLRHGSREGGTVDGIQLELHRVGLRDTDSNRRAFGRALASTVEGFMLEHYGFFHDGG